jgi:hypothetical protein
MVKQFGNIYLIAAIAVIGGGLFLRALFPSHYH